MILSQLEFFREFDIKNNEIYLKQEILFNEAAQTALEQVKTSFIATFDEPLNHSLISQLNQNNVEYKLTNSTSNTYEFKYQRGTKTVYRDGCGRD